MKNRVKELRKSLGLSQESFGEKLGVTKSSVSNMESGRFNVTDTIVKLICKEFNVNEYWLRDGEGPMFRPVKSVDNELSIEIAKLINSDDAFTKQCVLQYLKLSEESKELFKNFLVSVVDGCNEENKKAAPEEPLAD